MGGVEGAKVYLLPADMDPTAPKLADLENAIDISASTRGIFEDSITWSTDLNEDGVIPTLDWGTYSATFTLQKPKWWQWRLRRESRRFRKMLRAMIEATPSVVKAP